MSVTELEKEINRMITFKRNILYTDYEQSTFSKGDIKCTFQELRLVIKYLFKKYHKDKKKEKK